MYFFVSERRNAKAGDPEIKATNSYIEIESPVDNDVTGVTTSGSFGVLEGLEGVAYCNGYRSLTQHTVAIIGMSVGNPYFKQEIVDKLLPFCADKFPAVKIFITDVPARHSYEAEGYAPDKAAAKAKSKGNALRNRCNRTLQTKNEIQNVHFVDWQSNVENNPIYQDALSRIRTLYKDNSQFQDAVNSTVLAVICDQIKPGYDLEERVPIAATYLLEELAFLEAAPKILEILNFAYVYHRPWPIFERYVGGEFDGVAKPDLGLLIVKLKE